MAELTLNSPSIENKELLILLLLRRGLQLLRDPCTPTSLCQEILCTKLGRMQAYESSHLEAKPQGYVWWSH